MPFLHIYPELVDLTDQFTMEITHKNKESYMTTRKDFLSVATYAFIANHRLFRINIPANKLPRELFPAVTLPTNTIFPYGISDLKLRTITVQM